MDLDSLDRKSLSVIYDGIKVGELLPHRLSLPLSFGIMDEETDVLAVECCRMGV